MVETHTRILGIAPYDGMRTAMEQAAQAYPNVELEVYTGDLEEGQAIVQSMTPNSYDCIISRGGTATLIRQVTDLPVVDIHISVYDVLRTMKLAENYTSLYAIVGFPSITEPAHTLCSLLNFDLDILTVRSAEEVRHTLARLKQGGYRMVVCDMVTHTIAREMGFDAFLITSGIESLHSAIDQAVNISTWFGQLRQENLFLRSITQEQGGRVVVMEPSAGDPRHGQLKVLLHRAQPAVQHHSTGAADEQRAAVPVLLRALPHPAAFQPPGAAVAEPRRVRVSFLQQLLQPERCHGHAGRRDQRPCRRASAPIHLRRAGHRQRADCPLPLPAQRTGEPPPRGGKLRHDER